MKKTIRLTESDLIRVVKRILSEQPTELQPIENIVPITLSLPASDFVRLGGVIERTSNEVTFIDSSGRKWIVSKEWVWQQAGVDDQPRFLDPKGDGSVDPTFSALFNERKP